jgi:hypothetical protein
MTDPLRAKAESREVTALCEALEQAMRSFGHVSTAHYETPCRLAIAAALLSAQAEGREEVLEIVRTEEELHGPMPDAVQQEMYSDPDAVARAIVRATKRSIIERSLAKSPARGGT